MQRPDLANLCSSDLTVEELIRRACEENHQLCGLPFEKLCPNRPRPSSISRSQQTPTKPKPLFLRIIEPCGNSTDQPESDVGQKLDVLCEGLPSWIRHGRVLPSSASTPITDKVQDIIEILCKDEEDPLFVPDVVAPCNTWRVEAHRICNEPPSLLGCSLFNAYIQP